MEKSKNCQCGSVVYCERRSLMGLCTSKYDCENQLPIEVSKKHCKLPIYCVSGRLLDYDEWYAKFEDDINIELAETGADREMDFDSEREFEKRYEIYLNVR